MKIAVILGAFSTGTRPLDFWFNNIFISSRGLTGTDLSTVMISKELHQLGHDVSIFVSHAQPTNRPSEWEGCKLYDFTDRHTVIDESFDAIISINEPDAFRGVNSKPLRICWQFLNDYTYCQPGFDDFVDVWLSVCEQHMKHLQSLSPRPDKWSVLPLGCSPELYEDKRVPGRVIWTSSCDRGLHWLLSQWPQIKEAVPEANLKIFYHFNYGDILNIEPNSTTNHPHVVEMGQRLRYIKEAIKKLKPLDVTQVGSVSRVDMVKEMNEASVFAFSADTVAFTEGFSVSTMESHAGFTVPVMTDVDCLGSIYNNSGAVVIKSPIRDRLPEFTSSVIRALTDKPFADSVIDKCRAFSSNYTWKSVAHKMEDIIKIKGKK
jgi:glycosyltransferase involved in cell wall biosynthesis